MKKIINSLCVAVIISTFLSGCTAKEVFNEISDLKDYNDMVTSYDVHTEEEMRDFALYCLEEKYGVPFELSEDYSHYGHINGHEELSLALRGRAYNRDNEDYFCGFSVVEPNHFSDNYFVTWYLDDVKSIIEPELEKQEISAFIDLSYPLLQTTLDSDLTAEDILGMSNMQLSFYWPTELKDDIHDYLPEIRRWIDFLYSLDYNCDWYFAMTSEDDYNDQYFTIMKGDHGYTSADDWTDEEILNELHIELELIRSTD